MFFIGGAKIHISGINYKNNDFKNSNRPEKYFFRFTKDTSADQHFVGNKGEQKAGLTYGIPYLTINLIDKKLLPQHTQLIKEDLAITSQSNAYKVP
ncbi:hypothetical protein [uncultured Chryseobacterium sp.]|uniref:hypothetical protein n=1 Tax=uncultured Chryseobacterium sp. TaxID=259322 RepID=UPI0025DC1489|nr:hypothetical protein [uncultured Chryseobacterium sp.]